MKRNFRVFLGFTIIASLFYPMQAQAVSTDCTILSSTYCKATFTYSGAPETFTVPAGTTSIVIELAGAQGGSGLSAGGNGGYVKGTLAVTPGSNIVVYVGGQNGWNGGGAAGIGTDSGYVGGGASDIRIGGTALTDRKAVGGGGGGGGRASCSSQPGGGGGYPGGLGGTGGNTQKGGDGTSTNGGTVNGAYGGGNACTSSSFGGGGGGGNGGGAAGGYGVAAGGSSGTCGAANPNPSGGAGATNATGGCFGTGGAGGTYSGGAGGGGGGGWYGGGAGGANWASGGGGGSSYLGAMTSTSFTNASQTGNGYVTITYLNSPTPTTFSTSQSSPANIGTGDTISYSLVLSQSVSDLAVADFQLGGTSTCNNPGLSGSGTTYTVTLTNCSEGSVILQLKANSVTGTSTGPPTVSSANTVIIDRTAPTISTVSAPANKTYIPSETPTFSVVFSESITVVGSPRLQLTVGALTKYANYVSMSDSKTALFRYTVGTSAGEFDTNGIELNTTFDVNGGRIDDLAGNSMSLTTITAPVLTSVLVAQKASAPTITSITPGSSQLTVNFNAGASNGASITNYKYSLNGGAFTAASPIDTVTPLVITGLTNGTGYTIRILAVTLAGDGDSSTAVTETPSAILVTGDSTIVFTYGTSGSTGNYSASGGTNVFTWSLGSVISGVSLSGTSVSVANTLNAGIYTQTVRATDGASAVGSKQLTITINKASSTISLALQSGGNSTPVGQSPVITITTTRAGTVVFSAGGQVIAACSSISIASTSGTCTLPAPGGTGSLTLDAVFTPSSGNYDSATASISITIVDGVSTVTLSLAGGVVEVPKGQSINIIAAIDQAGKVSFYVDGKRLPGCFNKTFSAGNAICAWKPATQKQVSIRATLNPTNSIYNNSSSTLNVWVKRRAGLR